ncbi:hypothetical protein [Ideonella sp. B508-1]|uniref:hypothetical protein n=1 Tax=Ideonella sp. B508-1 TaxID=137716 RepID=UPI0011D1ACBC|nr:hypothetical protein [Ideonella sp. B508-1]
MSTQALKAFVAGDKAGGQGQQARLEEGKASSLLMKPKKLKIRVVRQSFDDRRNTFGSIIETCY